MNFPVIDKPIYTTNILSRKDLIQFTPFTVKESKILMMAKEAKDINAVVDALRQILTNCLVDKTIDVKKLAMVDLEWLFLNIQAKSSGETLPVYFECENQFEGNACGMVVEFELDLTKVQIANKDAKKRVMFTDTIGVEMKYPTFEAIVEVTKASDNEKDHLLAALCIDFAFTDTDVIPANTMSTQEAVNWIESLPTAKYEQVEQFLKNTPVIRETIEKDCSKCGYHHKITLEGLEDFFV